MTPEQISLVEETAGALGPQLDAVADDFYRTLFAADPSVRGLFSDDLDAQRTKFVVELTEIVVAIRHHELFLERARVLGGSHHQYGATAAHYRAVGVALLDALARALGERWTAEVSEAWRLAYNLIAESMMAAAKPMPSG